MEDTKKTPQESKKKVEATPVVEIKKKVEATPVVEAKKLEDAKDVKISLRNILGKEVPTTDYFYKGIVPAGFEGTCGKPVDREDLVELFHKVFKPKDNILFYKQSDKEVYIVIIPIKYSTTIGDFNDSIDGDFQKHAISFLDEGSVNIDTMRKKLERVKNFVNYSDR